MKVDEFLDVMAGYVQGYSFRAVRRWPFLEREDLQQEAWVRICRALPDLDLSHDGRAIAFGQRHAWGAMQDQAERAALEFERMPRVNIDAAESIPDHRPRDAERESERSRKLRAFLRRAREILKPLEFRALELRLAGLTVEEIARQLGRSKSYTQQVVLRATERSLNPPQRRPVPRYSRAWI